MGVLSGCSLKIARSSTQCRQSSARMMMIPYSEPTISSHAMPNGMGSMFLAWSPSANLMVNVGDKAPDFTLKAHDKSEVTLSSFSGSKVILSFYPAAFTGVCQNQACTINDRADALSSANCQVLGISVDSPFANNAFRDANGIDYPLLSDVHREVISAYGVTFDNFAIDGYTVAQRSVFVVEEDGTIGYAWYAENPGIEPDYDALFAHIGA